MTPPARILTIPVMHHRSLRILGLFVPAFLVLLCAHTPAAPQAPANESPTTTGSDGVGQSGVDPLPETIVDKLLRALQMTRDEEKVLADVADDSATPEESAFYLLMAKIADLPDVPDDQWYMLSQPEPKTLVDLPERYRYQPLQMDVRVFGLAKLTTDAGEITGGVYWPKDQPLWELHATAGLEPDPNAQPLILYTPFPPPGLPEAEEVDTPSPADGQLDRTFPAGVPYRAAAVFYKLLRRPSRGNASQPSRPQTYPALLVWYLQPNPGKADRETLSQSETFFPTGTILFALFVVLVLFVLVKQRVRSYKRGEASAHREGRAWDEEHAPDGPVDPDLAAAAEAYRREHGVDNDSDRQ